MSKFSGTKLHLRVYFHFKSNIPVVIYITNGLFSSFFLVILTKDLFYLSFKVTSFLFACKGIRILLYISSFSFIFISSFFLLSYGLFWVFL